MLKTLLRWLGFITPKKEHVDVPVKEEVVTVRYPVPPLPEAKEDLVDTPAAPVKAKRGRKPKQAAKSTKKAK